ncbi:hypothetical protein H920_09461 [Fukomys damarensis]|uniref:Uncharacterized protein n=1 Tax=Fukomys damarensis TaxID=885580 RepID=A0A091E1Z5_FUKDA|nr:hypothetical protein H920_09461 [Fukomys damarensis]
MAGPAGSLWASFGTPFRTQELQGMQANKLHEKQEVFPALKLSKQPLKAPSYRLMGEEVAEPDVHGVHVLILDQQH